MDIIFHRASFFMTPVKQPSAAYWAALGKVDIAQNPTNVYSE